MERNIKLIWDFRGPEAARTAVHHEIHLREYIKVKKLPLEITGVQNFGDMHATAWMVVEQADMVPVRDELKPHRGEIYQD